MIIDWEQLTDTALADAIAQSRQEQLRRQHMAIAVASVPELATTYMEVLGRVPGTAYVPPLGYHDAYPEGWIVTYEGKTWQATRNGAHETPGGSPDWRQVAEDGEILAWVQPHAGSEYEPGSLVTHEGHVWRNDYDAPNGWEPGTPHSQWTDLGPVEE